MKQSILILILSVLTFLVMLFSASWVILKCEQNAPGANITTYSSALWWTLNVSSVGDTSLQPVTPEGKVVGAIIIFLGVTIFALNTGVLSAIFTNLIKKEQTKISQQLNLKDDE
jgi:voltage-gated potassium channel